MENKNKRGRMIKYLNIVIFIGSVLFLFSCSTKAGEEGNDFLKGKADASEIYHFTGFKTYLTTEAKLTREILSEKARYYDKKQIFELDNLKVNFYGDKDVESIVVADKGLYDSKSKKVTLDGDVEYKDITNKYLKTDHMVYDGNTDIISSKSPFVFEAEQKDGTIVRNKGIGFETDAKFQNIKTNKGTIEFLPGKKKGKVK